MSISELKGKTIVNIDSKSTEIIFECSDGTKYRVPDFESILLTT